MQPLTTWQGIALAALALPQHEKLVVPRQGLPHPMSAGLYLSVGLARRCRHYRQALPDGRGLHVHVYADRYHIHWDAVDPSVSLARHFIHDVVHAMTRHLRRRHLPTLHRGILGRRRHNPNASLRNLDAPQGVTGS
jgi:hypothetical protein